MKKNLLADISLIFVTIIWGTSFGITKFILNSGLGPVTLMMYRSLFTIILLLPLLLFKLKKIKLNDINLGIKLGVLIFFGFLFQTVGASYTTGGKSAFLTTLNVIFVPLILFFSSRKKISLTTIVSSIIAISGASIMTLVPGEQTIRSESIGDLLTIIGSVFWALQIIKTSEYAKKADIWILVYFQFLVMFICSFITTLIFKQPLNLTFTLSLSIVYLTIFCTIIAFSVQAIATKYTTPEKAAIIFTFEGFFGAVFAFIIISEELKLATLFGGVVILMALIISETNTLDKLICFMRRKKWEDIKKI